MGQNYKNKKRFLIVATTILSLIFCLALSLFLYQRAYANKILHNVYFDNINLEGKTRVQAKTIIQNNTDPLLDNKIITKSTGKQYEATFSQTGVFFDIDQTVNNAFTVGRNDNFFKTLFSLSKTVFSKKEISPQPTFNNDEYQNYLANTQNNLSLPPVDASLTISNNKIVTNTGTNGLTVDASGLKDEIAVEILTKQETVAIEIPTTPVTPTLLSENLSSAKTIAENYLAHQINLTLSGQNYPADSNIISGWISFGLQNGKYAAWLNDTIIKTFLGKIAAKNDISVIDTKISAVDNTTVLQQGRQGIYIDQNDALSKIKTALSSSAAAATIALIQTTKDPQIIKVFPDEGIIPGRFPGKYIDISLSSQLLTLFDDTNQIGQYQVSTGKASTPTPVGTRTVQGHDPRAWSSPSSLWMPWFMALGGGYGIHELPEWPNGYKEGEAHLGTPVSHGCIRLGVGPAEFVYNWTPDGTQVYIHK
ncbi:MAG: peptidoglycan binding domain-containing protein [Candidatus Berkelbacteria bacterium]|nr:peptidoglycan binding domain-containing protein [Candidatus Berkelbacteria bacterium]